MKKNLHTRWYSIFLLLHFFVYGSPTFVQGQIQIKIGEARWWGHDFFQYWQTVRGLTFSDLVHENYDPLYNSVFGEIETITVGDDNPPFDDGDWRIFIKPYGHDSHFQQLITNSAGEVNEDRMIELEIKTPFPLGSYFHEGTKISAFGWWVEDFGHSAEDFDTPAGSFLFGGNGKTELHPIIYLRQDIVNTVRFFTAQDMSDRFTTVGSSVPKNKIIIPLPTYPVVNLSYSEYIDIPPSKTTRITEESIVDYVHESSLPGVSSAELLNMIQERQTNVAGHQDGDSFIIEPQVPPVVPFVVSFGGIKIYKLVSPFYFADIYSVEEELLKEEIEQFIRTNPSNGLQSLQFIITAELDKNSTNPEIRPIEYSSWKYDHVDIWGHTIELTEENPVENRVRFNLEYSPSMGMNDTEWMLEVNARNRPISWRPGRRVSTTQTGTIDKQERSFFHERRTYKLIPSSLQLNVNEIKSSIRFDRFIIDPNTGTGSNYSKCTTGYQITAFKNPVYPSVTSSTIGWNVQVSTAEITVPTIINLRSGEVKRIGSVELQLNDEGNKLIINFKNERSEEEYGYSNNSNVLVTAEYTTGIGEHPIASETFAPPICEQPTSPQILYDPPLFCNLLTAMVLFERQRVSVVDVLEKEWPNELYKNWPKYNEPSLLNKESISQLPVAYRKLIGEYIKKTKQKTNEEQLSKTLQILLDKAAKLPALERIPFTLSPTLNEINIAEQNIFQLLKKNQPVDIGAIEFDKNNALTYQSQLNLLGLSKQLKSVPQSKIKIYYDTKESKILSLSKRINRAQQVLKFLVNDGVGKNQLSIKGLERDKRSKVDKFLILKN